jgi:ssDNA-binding Zn-finger/Zn-ribbon topoisomerase 1
MKLRQGRHGPFLGCAAYPRCKGTLSVWSAGKSSPPKKPDPAPKQGRLAVVEINVPPCILCHEPMTKGQMGYVVAGTGWYHTKHQQ